jgi:hypothetical protein
VPQDLAALLVEGGAVSQADMERAVARQAQFGDALDTALLELGLIGEGQLLAFLAQASGLPPAPPASFKDVDARARRVFPAKVAERHRLAPFALDGRDLSVVAAHPVDAAAIDEIGFMLSLTLVPHVGVEWRVHDLIHRLYGGQLPARLAKLAEGAPRIAPAAESLPAAAAVEAGPAQGAAPVPPPPAPALSAVEEAFFAAGEAGTFVPAAAPPEATAGPPPPVGTSPGAGEETVPGGASGPAGGAAGGEPAADEASFADLEPSRPPPSGFGGDGSEPAEPLLAALEQAVDLYDALWSDRSAELPRRGEPAPVQAEPMAAAPAEPAPHPAPPEPLPAPPEPPPPAEGGGAEQPPAAEEPAETGETEEPPRELDRSAPPRWSIDDARTALGAARHRDEVVLTALRYARDFFEFSALFAVTRDAVVGHDALGVEGDERARCRGTAIYANDPGIVRTVLETGAPYLGAVARDAVGTSNILDGLWRGTPRTVLLYPILVAERPVAVLYADNGEAPVSSGRLGDLLLFLSTLGATFERIIRGRKKRRRAAAPRPAAAPPAAAPPEPEPPPWMAAPPEEGGPYDPGDAPPPSVPAGGPGMDPPDVASAEPSQPTGGPPPAPSGPGPAPAMAHSAVDGAMASLLSGGGDPDGASAIVDLVLGADPAVAAAARGALMSHRAEPAVKPLPERLRRALLSGVGERPILAARALGALRDVSSIPILIQALEGGSRLSAVAAAEALAQITLQRLGPSPEKWLKWWKENRGRSRAEWLFAALASPDRELRLAASGELRAAGDPPVRYSVDLPAAELEAAARAWWEWWSRLGMEI